MILLTGTYATAIPFEVTMLPPRVFTSQHDVLVYIKDYFSHMLREKYACGDSCLTDGWETGMTFQSNDTNGNIQYRVYAEKKDGVVSYHLSSETLHIAYRIDSISLSRDKTAVLISRSQTDITGSNTLYWHISSNKYVTIALHMALVTAYTAGKISSHEEIPKTYEEVSKLVPDDDPITSMIIVYSMLKADGKYAFFHIQDGSIFLYSDEGFIGVDNTVEGFEDGSMCDPESLYAFSPMYNDIPSTADGAVEMFKSIFKPNVEEQFRTLLTDAFSPGLNWRHKVENMLPLLDITKDESDATMYKLMRVVGKYKLLKGANSIFSEFPCSYPNTNSP